MQGKRPERVEGLIVYPHRLPLTIILTNKLDVLPTAAEVWVEMLVHQYQYPLESQMWPTICRIAFSTQPGLFWTKGPTDYYERTTALAKPTTT